MTRKEKTRAKRTALIRALARKWLAALERQMHAVEMMEN
jgi:hypothetical protein